MPTKINFKKISKSAEQALKNEFPDSVMSVEEGWHGRVHLKIVSNVFNGKSETAKQEAVWEVLKTELGAESDGVSLVLVYGLDEL